MNWHQWRHLDNELSEALSRIAGAMEFLELAGSRLPDEQSGDGAMVTKCAADLYSMYRELGKVHGRLGQMEVTFDD